MPTYRISTHLVKNFDAWKCIFKQFEPIKKEAGERSAVVLRLADAPNTVNVINTRDSIDASQAFLDREELKSALSEFECAPVNTNKTLFSKIITIANVIG